MRRIIKSFVLRTGRVSNRQQMALDNWVQDYSLPLDQIPWDIPALFGREAKTIVEIGFGMGTSLFNMAQQAPDTNFIGIEVHLAGVGSLAADIHDHDLQNLRLVAHDAVEVFQQQIAPQSLDGVQIFFPDPWHKKRHNKRRLIQPDFVRMVAERLKPGAFLHCATDWQDYADHMMSILSAEATLCNIQPAGQFAPRPDSRPLTKFEQRGQRLGHGVWDLMFQKI